MANNWSFFKTFFFFIVEMKGAVTYTYYLTLFSFSLINYAGRYLQAPRYKIYLFVKKICTALSERLRWINPFKAMSLKHLRNGWEIFKLVS